QQCRDRAGRAGTAAATSRRCGARESASASAARTGGENINHGSIARLLPGQIKIGDVYVANRRKKDLDVGLSGCQSEIISHYSIQARCAGLASITAQPWPTGGSTNISAPFASL